MPPPGDRRKRTIAWGLSAAILLHLLLGLVLVLMPGPRPLAVIPERGIDVEIVTEPPEHAPAAPTRLPSQPDRPAAAPTAPPVPNVGPRSVVPPPMVKAARMLSGAALADPRNRPVVQTLPLLAPDERMEQLCVIEAIEQIRTARRDTQPDRLVAYAMAETRTAGNALSADGGAFHSKGEWYAVRFRCELTPDHARVAAFEFAVGDAIPRGEWARHNLPATDAPSD